MIIEGRSTSGRTRSLSARSALKAFGSPRTTLPDAGTARCATAGPAGSTSTTRESPSPRSSWGSWRRPSDGPSTHINASADPERAYIPGQSDQRIPERARPRSLTLTSPTLATSVRPRMPTGALGMTLNRRPGPCLTWLLRFEDLFSATHGSNASSQSAQVDSARCVNNNYHY